MQYIFFFFLNKQNFIDVLIIKNFTNFNYEEKKINYVKNIENDLKSDEGPVRKVNKILIKLKKIQKLYQKCLNFNSSLHETNLKPT